MSDPSSGQSFEPESPQRLRALLELLASMRFAIALLTIICIASVIGTVLKQHEPSVNYVNQFGPFWAELFLALKLNAVYSAWWFLLILAFLVISTSLCLLRHTPKYLADLRNYKENIREQSLKAFHHKAEAALGEAPQAAAQRIGGILARSGWKVKLQERETPAGKGYMLAAKAGAANKLGYIAAHAAIVLICIGGLLDGDLIVRAQMWLGGKTPYTGGGRISDVPPEHRLSLRNPTFRGNLMVAEGTQAGTAILNQSDGVLLQELPFSVELKKFIVEYYDTGMPKLFASEVVIHDRETGEQLPQRIEVNHPASYKGIEIYQSSFDDGGSRVKLRAVPFAPGSEAFEVEGHIGTSTQLMRAGSHRPEDVLTLEFTELRTINVENFTDKKASSAAVDVRKVDLRSSIEARLGGGHKTVTDKELRNIGPSIGYKLRDASGQAREYQNYMSPVDFGDGVPMFLLGVRENPSESFRYLRVPADEQGSMQGFLRMRAALNDPVLREEAVRRYAAQAVPKDRTDLRDALAQSALRAVNLFAGSGTRLDKPDGGLQAIAQFMEANVPEAERERASEVLIRILNGVLFDLAQLSREKAGLPVMQPSDQTLAFMTQSVFSLSDAQFFPAPMAFMLEDFTQVQASVFQVARAPGKNIVYLGCLFLIIGVFAMLYVRDRRLWVWISPQGEAARATMALSSNRKIMDTDREFENLTEKLLTAPAAAPSSTERSV
ncbi:MULTISPECIES: cytochrome c biogenesis protein ResB [Comamonas]|uniref:Cytochrome c biogenesis protein ResB n=1 Tax=Comamonas aquatica TaxID=225991 RepID=A0AA42HRL1_9BURK|nr:cytochrome c biogenesis protein ResB [Comamonas aquatica]MDE1556824.1 cytochrome c biogenesis protein ResB [Comamonas aquatica]MDH0363041.1 cytochrome c biogenesis protein ResB [Comamonas aquatica]MDH1767296.1 cytochrome c biogenesis protein ResB [Comamonas aquatica]